jgi:hypothetical protein
MTTTIVRQTTRRETRLEPDIRNQRSQWLTMLRTGCETVGCSQTISATTAAAHFEGLAVIQRHYFLRLAEELAADYGVDVETTDNGTHLEARFSRTVAAVTVEREVHHRSLPSTLGSLVGWRYST